MPVGFELEQRLAGTYHRLDSPGQELPLTLTLRIRVPGVSRLVLTPKAELSGTIDAEGLVTGPIEGSLELKPAARKLVYDFRFMGDDGRPRRFHGEMELEARRPVATLTNLPGRIFDDSEEEARVLIRMPLGEELLELIKSVRPA